MRGQEFLKTRACLTFGSVPISPPSPSEHAKLRHVANEKPVLNVTDQLQNYRKVKFPSTIQKVPVALFCFNTKAIKTNLLSTETGDEKN